LSKLSPAAALKCINKQLQQSANVGHIKYVLRPSTQTPLTKVQVTSTERRTDPLTGDVSSHKTVEIIDIKAELESRILARNKKHFAQTEHTPFTKHPLKSMHVGEDLDKYFDLEGNPLHLPNGTFKENVTVLQLIQEAFHGRPPTIDSVILFEAFVTLFLHWDEKTATSPSGRHLVGLYKSLVTAHIDSGNKFGPQTDDDADTPTVQEKATDVLHAIHAVAVSVAQRSLYLDQWIRVVNAMIYKKAGVLELDKLRVIHLFEADFNLLVTLIFGRRTVHNAVNHQKLHPSQFGKKGGECMDAAISKVLHNVIATYTKTPLGQFESDATACFELL
jgi:hypothetical protein